MAAGPRDLEELYWQCLAVVISHHCNLVCDLSTALSRSLIKPE
ncbi:hypothetical protein TcasGA2_TC004484 [Tribolium castaneum]|uniref:Uncharacterized protein n=1 Tax=Tribolium castaneum TaxID=7070 RepID=D6WCH4_TRICA|nr:hypothetical protein TcasGA2_TC004484 [Tribolium castaneum]